MKKRKPTKLEQELVDALRLIIANMIDTENDRNPETGKVYGDFYLGRRALRKAEKELTGV